MERKIKDNRTSDERDGKEIVEIQFFCIPSLIIPLKTPTP